MKRVIVFGSINMDFVVQVPRNPVGGETVMGKTLNYFPGGKGANQAVSAAQLGAETLMFGKVGSDGSAEFLVDFLKEKKVDVSNIKKSETSTGSAFITIDDAGENAIIVIPGSNAEASFQQFQNFKFQKGDILICQNEILPEEILKSFQKAKEEGASIIYNPAPAIAVSRGLFDLADYVVVNETEATFYEEYLDLSKHVIIKTLGKGGVKVITDEKTFDIPAHEVSVVDSTGAGDCFTGALAFSLSKGDALKQAIELANKCASIAIQREGAGTSMPCYEEVA